MSRPSTPGWPGLIRSVAASARMANVLATIGVGLAVCTFSLQRLIGWAGLLGALVTLLLLMVASFAARRRDVDWHGILPISLLAFLGWATISIVWSQYQWATVGGLAYLFAFTLVGLYVALMRDTIQVVRSFGDVLRVVLGLSLVIEVFSGLLIDAPIAFLGVQGHIAAGGPISGILATRNQLGLVAIVGAITFMTEHRTRSVPSMLSMCSHVLAALCIVFTLSPVVFGAAFMVAVAALVLYGLRRVRLEHRQAWQVVTLGAAAAGAALAWAGRALIVDGFNATGVLTYRLDLWNKEFDLVRLNFLQGWGWIGRWHPDIVPFSGITTSASRPAQSGLNGYLDIWLQLGLIGLVIFVGMLGLAFVRSWLLAGRRRSVVYAWPALVLVALLIVSLAESSLLAEFGWLAFVICCVKASHELSWRAALISGTGESGP